MGQSAPSVSFGWPALTIDEVAAREFGHRSVGVGAIRWRTIDKTVPPNGIGAPQCARCPPAIASTISATMVGMCRTGQPFAAREHVAEIAPSPPPIVSNV